MITPASRLFGKRINRRPRASRVTWALEPLRRDAAACDRGGCDLRRCRGGVGPGPCVTDHHCEHAGFHGAAEDVVVPLPDRPADNRDAWSPARTRFATRFTRQGITRVRPGAVRVAGGPLDRGPGQPGAVPPGPRPAALPGGPGPPACDRKRRGRSQPRCRHGDARDPGSAHLDAHRRQQRGERSRPGRDARHDRAIRLQAQPGVHCASTSPTRTLARSRRRSGVASERWS